MKSAKRKVKDGKVHKKARVARFITNNFYFWYANKVMDTPNVGSQLIHQPVNHRSTISNHSSYNNKKDNNTLEKHNNNNQHIPLKSNSTVDLSENNNKSKNTNSDDDILEIETMNKPFPQCIFEVIPKSFDIVHRGPLPSIIFQNNKINIIESC